jgi:hypothetical protein
VTTVRTRFGITNNALRAQYYDADDPFDSARERMLAKHQEEIAGREVLRGPELVDESSPHVDGLEFAWVSEVAE